MVTVFDWLIVLSFYPGLIKSSIENVCIFNCRFCLENQCCLKNIIHSETKIFIFVKKTEEFVDQFNNSDFEYKSSCFISLNNN